MAFLNFINHPTPVRTARTSHPDWQFAAKEAVYQLQPVPLNQHEKSLGLIYTTEALEAPKELILKHFQQSIPGVSWICHSAYGVCASGVEYLEQPALVAMILPLQEEWWTFAGSSRNQMRSASGRRASAILVHAVSSTSTVNSKITRLADQTSSNFLFGGVTACPQKSGLKRDEIEISGVAFGNNIKLLSKRTQGCTPIAKEHIISDCASHYIRLIDDRPALDVLLEDLGIKTNGKLLNHEEILRVFPSHKLSNGLMIGIAPKYQPAKFGLSSFSVSNVVGIDPKNRLLAVAAIPTAGEKAVFCTRDRNTARADLIRTCTELREELENKKLFVLGAHYVSCVARGPYLFGDTGMELKLIEHNLGNVPLIGFFGDGEIAGNQIYEHSGVLTLFVTEQKQNQAHPPG